MEEIQKATHEQITLWAPVIKGEGKYIAVLSDDSMDRDGEVVGKSALQKALNNDGYTVALMDHQNKVLNQVGEWTNKRMEFIDGHNVLVAEPKFYLSNPNAQIIKGMLDEGAQMGVSIGAIIKSSEKQKINGVDCRVYTDIELLEASFCAIPSNRHGRAMAMAKMFGEHKHMEEIKLEEETKSQEVIVEKTFTQKEFDEATNKYVTEKDELQKQFDSLAAEKKLTDEELAKSLSDIKELQTKLEELGKVSMLKGAFQTDEVGDGSKQTADITKAIKEGKLPIVNR
jgi:HK97 family phage prohead protease